MPHVLPLVSIGGSLLLAAGIVIDEKTAIPIGSTFALMVGAGTFIYWFGKKIQKWDDMFREIFKRLEKIENGCTRQDCPLDRGPRKAAH